MSKTMGEIARHPIRALALLGLALAVAAVALWIGGTDSRAVHNQGLLELDGNTVFNGGVGSPAATFDWEDVCEANAVTKVIQTKAALPANATVATCVADWMKPDQTYFDSNKDIQDIAPAGTDTWSCVQLNNPLDKNEILNTYSVLGSDPVSGDTKLYFGFERATNTGTSYMAFWFLQGEASCTHSGNGSSSWESFGSEPHSIGDVLVLSDFTGGGKVSTIQVAQWDPGDAKAPCPNTPGEGLRVAVNLCRIATGADCQDVAADDNICGRVNSATITTPWLNEPDGPDCKRKGVIFQGAAGTAPCTVPLAANQFFEGGINLSQVLGPNLPCFSNFLAETRSSAEFTATLKDYGRGDFDTCGSITIIKDVTSPPTDPTDFSFNAAGPEMTPAAFVLDDDPASATPNSQKFDPLTPNGDRFVRETVPTGWELHDIDCTSQGDGVIGTNVFIGTSSAADFSDFSLGSGTAGFDPGDNTVRIVLGDLQHISCTFKNRQLPDVTVLKTAFATPISAGEQARFDITVTNLGPGTAQNVTLTDTLPAVTGGWAVGGADAASCNITSGVNLSCNFGNIAEGGTRTISVTSTPAFADCGNLPNTARVDADNEDPGKLGNNESSATIVVQCPDLAVAKSGTIRYTLSVTNSGPGTAFNVNLNDTLPGGGLFAWSVVSVTPAATCSISSNNILSCGPFASAGAGTIVTVTVEAAITASTCGTNTTLVSNTGTATATNHPDRSATAVLCSTP